MFASKIFDMVDKKAVTSKEFEKKPREVKEDTRQVLAFLRRIGVFNVRAIEKALEFSQGTIRMDGTQHISRTKLDRLETFLSEIGFSWDDAFNIGHKPDPELAKSEKLREDSLDSFHIEGGVYLHEDSRGFRIPQRFISLRGVGRYINDPRAAISVPDGYEDYEVKVIPVDSRTVQVKKENRSVENIKVVPIIKRNGNTVVKSGGTFLLIFYKADDLEE